ncbi:MAG: type II toxin-antitoxin system RatA family toxin [Pseudomonadales bacterium]
MPVVNRSALLPYPAADVFAIINDVRRYPEFLPWCAEAVVVEETEQLVTAELALRTHGIEERFTTRNLLEPYERIVLELVTGPFRRFSGSWTFQRLGADEGCKVALALDFEFGGARAIVTRAFAGVFVGATDRLVDAFCERAHELLGSSPGES